MLEEEEVDVLRVDDDEVVDVVLSVVEVVDVVEVLIVLDVDVDDFVLLEELDVVFATEEVVMAHAVVA